MSPASNDANPAWRLLQVLAAALLVVSCEKHPGELHLEGKTMGTTWHATVLTEQATSEEITTLVQSRLDELEAIFTNWRETSAVSKFNASSSSEWQEVPRELAEVVAFARTLSTETGGAFDVTISPLIDLWGFGAAGHDLPVPDDQAIAQALAHCGWRKLEVQPDPPRLRRLDPALQINVSALVEGYAIDDLVRRLGAQGIHNFLLEVGGELYASGTKADGSSWQVGIQQPRAEKDALAGAIPVTNRALATSGTYRQYRELQGRQRPHILDARTGRPVEHSLVSVSVNDASCFHADGWATALLSLGRIEGEKLAEKAGVAALFIESKMEIR